MDDERRVVRLTVINPTPMSCRRTCHDMTYTSVHPFDATRHTCIISGASWSYRPSANVYSESIVHTPARLALSTQAHSPLHQSGPPAPLACRATLARPPPSLLSALQFPPSCVVGLASRLRTSHSHAWAASSQASRPSPAHWIDSLCRRSRNFPLSSHPSSKSPPPSTIRAGVATSSNLLSWPLAIEIPPSTAMPPPASPVIAPPSPTRTLAP